MIKVAKVRTAILVGGVTLTLGALAACAPKPAPAPPPPPPPPVVVIPPRPMPPMGASPNVALPLIGVDGLRQTVNTRISPAQTTWNLRSAYNVAALNCLRPEHADILVGYKAYLKTHAKGLAAANKAVDSEFRGRYGTSYIRPREAYMTQVYNYFAFPPTLQRFCDAAVTMSRQSLLVKPADLATFSATSLPQIDSVFDQFFRAYEQYRIEAALWDSRYAPPPVPAPVMTATTPPIVLPSTSAVAAPVTVPAAAPAAAPAIVLPPAAAPARPLVLPPPAPAATYGPSATPGR